MVKIICFGLVLCATLALASAYPAEPAPEDPKARSLVMAPVFEEAEGLQPEESRWGHGGGGWGHGGGWGYGGGYGRGGWGHGGYGHGGHGGYGHGGYGHGGYGGGWGR